VFFFFFNLEIFFYNIYSMPRRHSRERYNKTKKEEGSQEFFGREESFCLLTERHTFNILKGTTQLYCPQKAKSTAIFS